VGVVFRERAPWKKSGGGMRSDEEQLTHGYERIYFWIVGKQKELFVQKRAPQSKNIFFTRFVFFVSKFSRDTKKIIPHTN
jgi:hypothetical protein